MSNNCHENHGSLEWGRAKAIRERSGLTAPQLMRYAEEGLIRTSHVRRPGQTRGVRLFHLGDIHQLIISSIEPHSNHNTAVAR